MMMLTVDGNLGADAELRSADGTQVLNFRLATQTGFGETAETVWIDCAIWGSRAASLSGILRKGLQVFVVGNATVRTFERRDGTTGYGLAVRVVEITLQKKDSRDA